MVPAAELLEKIQMLIARKITIVVRGISEEDVQDAFDEAVDRLSNGCSSGSDRNDSSGFYFRNEPLDLASSEMPA